MTGCEMLFIYKGKHAHEMTREELFEVIEYLRKELEFARKQHRHDVEFRRDLAKTKANAFAENLP